MKKKSVECKCEATGPLTTPPLTLVGCLRITGYPSEFCKPSLGAPQRDKVLFSSLDLSQSKKNISCRSQL